MAFFTVNTNEENVKDYVGNGGKYLNKSGIYEIVIKNAFVDVSKNGSQSISLFFEYEGQPQTIYSAIRLTNNNGTPNIGAALFNKLAVVCGASEGSEIADPVPMQLPVGAGGTMKECMVLEDFNDMPVYMRLQMEYGMYEGKIQERKNIRNFFRVPDKATAAEIVNNTEVGLQYEKELEYADKVTYKDDLTEEDVAEWIKNRGNKDKEETSASKPAPISFGQKRSFSRS